MENEKPITLQDFTRRCLVGYWGIVGKDWGRMKRENGLDKVVISQVKTIAKQCNWTQIF